MKKIACFLCGVLIFTVLAGGCNKAEVEETEGTSETRPSVLEESLISEYTATETTVETTPPPTPEPTPTLPPQNILVSFIGDCTLAEAAVWDGTYNGFDAVVGGDMEYCFKNATEILSKDDMTLANFEGTLTTSSSHKAKEYAFAGDPSYVEMLTYGSIEAVNLANNHTDDYFDVGINDTKSILEENGILWSDETNYSIFEVNGIKIGMAGTTFPTNQQAMYNAIDKLREDGCQIVIISCHWGIEKDYLPRDDQVVLAHNLIDYGADIVVGTHPHRLQPIEYYNGHYILYCLSNFCFGGNTSLGDPDSCIVQCNFRMDETNSYVVDYELTVIPYCQTTVWPGHDYCPKPYDWSSPEYYRVLEKLDWLQEDE